MGQGLAGGMHIVLSVSGILWLVGGSLVGILVGALPGIGPLTGIALLLPLTAFVKPIDAILFYVTLYQAAEYGGSITAIAISTPGAPNSAALILDGYPMTKAGHAKRAFGYSLWTAVLVSAATAIFLLLLAPVVANAALAFGPADYAALGILALVAVGFMLGSNLAKGIASVTLGFALATVGTDPITGSNRFTFGSPQLAAGIALVPLLIGIFAVPVALEMIVGNKSSGKRSAPQQDSGLVWLTMRDWWRVAPEVGIGTLVGGFMGLLPGMSGSGPPFVAYNLARLRRLRPDAIAFGEGAPGGVAVVEAANAASMHATLVPTFSLGVPGTPTSALILAAMTIVGLQPGPDLFKNNLAVPDALFLGLLIGSFALWIVAMVTMNVWLRVLRISESLLGSIVILLAIVGSYAVSSSTFDVLTLSVFGIVGILLRRYDFPLAPLALGFILEPIIENHLRQALALDRGAIMPFLTDPIVDVCLALGLVLLFWSRQVRRTMRMTLADVSEPVTDGGDPVPDGCEIVAGSTTSEEVMHGTDI